MPENSTNDLPIACTPAGTDLFTAWALSNIAPLRDAIWRAMVEIENGYPDAAFETLQHAWENSR